VPDHPIVTLINVHKHYLIGSGRVEALKGINLRIETGEYLSIMGPSGSGKSTLINLIGCLDHPSSGQLHLEGINLNAYDDNALSLIRASRIGHVFQSFNLIAYLNVLENVMLPFSYALTTITKEDARTRAIETIRDVGLAHRMMHRPSELSGGEMQRVAIARALVIQPAIIIADEPTGNLDVASSHQILALFHHMHEKGTTVVMITHDPDVAKHAARKIVLNDGKIETDQVLA